MKTQQTADGLLLVLETSRHPNFVENGWQEWPSKQLYAASGLAAQLVESVTPLSHRGSVGP